MKIVKYKYLFLFIIFLLGAVYWVFTRRHDIPQVCKGDTSPIAYKRLSTEQDYPFLILGQPLSSWKERAGYDEYKRSITRFPDVRACLSSSEKEKLLPNLAKFDWETIHGTQDAEVCIFRVASSIGSIDGVNHWLESQGFRLSESFAGNTNSAYWSIGECGVRFRSNVLDKLLQRFFVKELRISAELNADGEPASIWVGFGTE